MYGVLGDRSAYHHDLHRQLADLTVHWILYIFGASPVYWCERLPMKMNQALATSPLVWLRGHLRMTDTIDNEHFFVRKNGLLYATPLMLVLIVELSDVIFAVDSIPAIFAVTTDPFIVLTSNLFAILGLRAMYFLPWPAGRS